jgi:hypothetical protein
VWQEFSSSKTHEFGQTTANKKGFGGENTHSKLSSQPNSLYLAYNMQPHLLYRSTPTAHLTSHCVHRCAGAHFAQTTSQTASNSKRQRRETWSFFVLFCPPPSQRFSRHFSLQQNTHLLRKLFNKLIYYILKILYFFNIYNPKQQKLYLHISAHKIQNDKHMFRHIVCIVFFCSRFAIVPFLLLYHSQ